MDTATHRMVSAWWNVFFIIFQCEGFLHCNHIVSVKSCACPKNSAARCSDPSNSSWLIPQKCSHHAKVNGVGVEFAIKNANTCSSKMEKSTSCRLPDGHQVRQVPFFTT